MTKTILTLGELIIQLELQPQDNDISERLSMTKSKTATPHFFCKWNHNHSEVLIVEDNQVEDKQKNNQILAFSYSESSAKRIVSILNANFEIKRQKTGETTNG